MRKQHIFIAVAAVTAVASVQPAQAQDTGTFPFRAKVGVFLPHGDVKGFAGSTGYNAEVDAALPNIGQGRYMLSAGYYRDSKNGQAFSMVPITIGRIFSPANPFRSGTGNVYFGLGAGAYIMRATGGTHATKLGGYAMAGYQFPNPYFIEAKYQVAGRVGGITPRGFTLMVGRHF